RRLALAAPPIAVAFEPNPDSGSLPSRARSSAGVGRSFFAGAFANGSRRSSSRADRPSRPATSGRPGSVNDGGVAEAIAEMNTPPDASRLAAYTPYQRSLTVPGRT